MNELQNVEALQYASVAQRILCRRKYTENKMKFDHDLFVY